MKHYLSLIRKSDFTDLFKFGYLYIDTQGVVEFDGNLSSLSQNIKVRDRLFERTNQFDYSFTVLLVYFKSDLKDGKLNVEEVQNIFALDNEAKREIEISYDPRIRIDNPIWPDAVTKLQERFLFEDAKKGALNIWNILKIEQPLSEVESIFTNDDLKEIAFEVQNDKRPEGELSFWVYLLRYERHGFFPKTTAGFFMDLVNVFLNTLKHQEQQSEIIEQTKIYHKILEFQDLQMTALIKRLSETSEGRSFFDKVDKLAGNKTSAFIIALLYLVLKQKHINGFNLSETKTIKYGQKQFPEEINYALYFLGIFLGNSHTFECLYDTLPLPVFKTIVPITLPKLKSRQKPAKEDGKEQIPFPQEDLVDSKERIHDTDSDNKLGGLFMSPYAEENASSEQRPTKRVRTPGTKGTKGTKVVRSVSQFYSFIAQGYIAEPKYGYLTD